MQVFLRLFRAFLPLPGKRGMRTGEEKYTYKKKEHSLFRKCSFLKNNT